LPLSLHFDKVLFEDSIRPAPPYSSRASSPSEDLQTQIVQLQEQLRVKEKTQLELENELMERNAELVLSNQNREFFETQAMEFKEYSRHFQEKCCSMFLHSCSRSLY
jgi:hypothetical protein